MLSAKALMASGRDTVTFSQKKAFRVYKIVLKTVGKKHVLCLQNYLRRKVV